jgi:hypothetical protein
MKERMRTHIEMMESMIENGEMNHSQMEEINGDSSAMNRHMMCMQVMMQGDKMDNKSMMDRNRNESRNRIHEQRQK